MTHTLTCSQLSVGYGTKAIARGIDLTILPGQLVSLIGPNGIGKTTLLRTLSGLQAKLSGEVSILARPQQDYTRAELSRLVSVVLTETLPPSNLSVYELIATGRQPYTNWVGNLAAADKRQIDEAISMTEVDGLLHKKAHHLSDGQLQIVMIARALAQDTPLIILDEPATHLDLVHKTHLFRLMRQLANSGKSLLFSTHEVEMALQASDSIVMMTGTDVIQGTPSEFLKQNYLNRLFDTPDISFDPEKVKFVFKGI